MDSDHQQQGGHYLELPQAISDPHGTPHKSTKSYATKWLEKHYKNIVTSHLSSGWIPDVVVLETTPSTNLSMMEYSLFLFRLFVCPHYLASSTEVHLAWKATVFSKDIGEAEKG